MKALKYLFLFGFLLTSQLSRADYICYYLINLEIRHTVEEHERQKDMRDGQAENLALETFNENKWSHFKETMSKIQSRLNHASFAIQAIPSSVKIVGEIKKVYEIQEKIYQELNDAPAWIGIAIGDQVEFVDKLQMNIRLMAGIILSYGTINQMEKAERKILLDFCSQEFRNLRIHSWSTLSKIKTAKRKWQQRQNMLRNWVNKDKKIIQDIIRNAERY